LDGDVEEFDADNRATGIRFHVQLKATDEPDIAKALAINVALDKAEYYRSLALPVLMVRYHAPTQHLFTRWFHQYDPYYGRGGEKTLAFRWSEDDRWTDARAEQLVAEVRAFRELQSAVVSLPVDLYLDQPEGVVFGINPLELAFSLSEATAARPDVLRFRDGNAPSGVARIEVHGDRIVANLAEVGTATLHLTHEYGPDMGAETLAADALVVLALAFAHVGQADLAARLAETYVPGCSVIEAEEAAIGLSAAMGRARRVREALHLADLLDGSDEEARRDVSFIFTLPALAHGDSLSAAERSDHRATLQRRIDRRLDTGLSIEASREYVNLGNAYRRTGEAAQAVELYRSALDCDPEYGNRAHYWYELGGVLFGNEEYLESADAYARAIALGADDLAIALQGDASLFAGRYAEALALFAEFNELQSRHGAEYRLKESIAREIVEGLGIAQQERDPDAAQELQEALSDRRPEEELDALREALALDALDPDAWLNLARGAMVVGDPRCVMLMATAAVLREGDLDVWAMAIALAFGSNDEAFLADMVANGAFRCGARLRSHLARLFRDFNPPSERDKLLRRIAEIWTEVAEEPTPGFTMRWLKPDGSVEEIPVGPPEPEVAHTS
jgi:tetratricopeptide (TPR) repeat protein